jgi:serine protease Do
MKKLVLSAAALMALNLVIVGTSFGQDGEKSKPKSKLGEYEEIIIKKKSDGDSKVTVEIKDGEVKVDGKPIDEYESEALSVRRRKPAVIGYGTAPSPFRNGNVTINGNTDFFRADSNRAFLGITSIEASEGVRIGRVTEESAAEKAGLKSGDIITKIDDTEIDEPSEVTKVIRKHKPQDKVTITYKRDGKEAKTTATLGKSNAALFESFGLNEQVFPRLEGLRSMENLNWDSRDRLNEVLVTGRPRIGIRAQDTEESNGARVLDVADESAAEKAGIKENDLITSFDGKNIKTADDLSMAAREARDKSSIDVKLNRDGKAQTIQIKIPKKLKTTSL